MREEGLLLPTILSALSLDGKKKLTAAACSSAEYPCDIISVDYVVSLLYSRCRIVSSRYQYRVESVEWRTNCKLIPLSRTTDQLIYPCLCVYILHTVSCHAYLNPVYPTDQSESKKRV